VLQRNYNLIRQASRHAEVHLLAVLQRRILPVEVDMAEVRRELGRLCASLEIVELPIDTSRAVWAWKVASSTVTRDPFSVNWIKHGPLGRRIRERFRETSFDLAHFDTVSLAAYLDDTPAIPRILNHHNIESDLILRRIAVEPNVLKRTYYRMEGRKLRDYEIRTCPKFDLNFTVSADDAAILHRDMPGLPIEVVPNGVDVGYFRSGGSREVPGRLIFVGGMNWYPNRDAVRFLCDEIWPRLRSGTNPPLSMTIVGAHPPPELLELASRDSRVSAPGFVDDVRPYFDEAQIYICPMRDGGGTRLKILDALAMGKPMVSTVRGCEGIEVVDGRHVLLADDPERFAGAIVQLAGDAGLRARLAEAGRSLVERTYSWEVIGDHLGRIYDRLHPAGAGNGA